MRKNVKINSYDTILISTRLLMRFVRYGLFIIIQLTFLH